jgi:hypothetical protein
MRKSEMAKRDDTPICGRKPPLGDAFLHGERRGKKPNATQKTSTVYSAQNVQDPLQ